MSCNNRRKKYLHQLVSTNPALNEALAGQAPKVLETIYQRAGGGARLVNNPTGAGSSISFAGLNKPAPTRAALLQDERDCTALFLEFQGLGIGVPTHATRIPGQVVALPDSSTQAKYAEMYRTIKAITTGQPLPPLAQSFMGYWFSKCNKCGRFFNPKTGCSADHTDKVGNTSSNNGNGGGQPAQAGAYEPNQPELNTSSSALTQTTSSLPPSLLSVAAAAGTAPSSLPNFLTNPSNRVGLSPEAAKAARAAKIAPYEYDEGGFAPDGFNQEGFDREGFDREGFDNKDYNRHGFHKISKRNRAGYTPGGFNLQGRDREGYNQAGYDKSGYDRVGFNRAGLDVNGFNAGGFSYNELDKDKSYAASAWRNAQGYDPIGYDPHGYDHDGYDRDGYNRAGYDRNGYNVEGKNKSEELHPYFTPDRDGFYGDGLDEQGYGRDGYHYDGYDRAGYNRADYDAQDFDRDGFSRDGYNILGFNRAGYNKRGLDKTGFDVLGYNDQGFDRQGFTLTGFDLKGYDTNGFDRWGFNEEGLNPLTNKRRSSPIKERYGYNKNFDRWGFNRKGLTADGRNYAGWIYDPQTNECYDPANPAQRITHYFSANKSRRWVTSPKVAATITPPITPHQPMTEADFERAFPPESGEAPDSSKYKNSVRYRIGWHNRSQVNILPHSRWGRERAKYDPEACVGGECLRCPKCGQFVSKVSDPADLDHQCPAFNKPQNYGVKVYRSGYAVIRGQDPKQNADQVFLKPHSDAGRGGEANPPPYMFGGTYSPFVPAVIPGAESSSYQPDLGYDSKGFDQQGLDVQGYDHAGFNKATGFNRQGYDRYGYDRYGYDRDGFNRAGANREGQRRGEATLDDLRSAFDGKAIKGDPINNEGIRSMLAGLCSTLTGKRRKIVFREGQGFATDMNGTIYLDPYPLGRQAPVAHNLAVMTGGMEHELGHELYTNPDHWRTVLELANNRAEQAVSEAAGLDETGRSLVTHIYNILEDGRMERQVGKWAGAAQHLALSCKLQPRWDEKVGPGVGTSHQVYGALLYTALPYFRVGDEVRAGMTPKARVLFEELEPLARQGVLGSQQDTLEATFAICRRLQAERQKFEPPKTDELDVRPPADPDTLEHNGEGAGRSSQPQTKKKNAAATGQSSAGQDQEQEQGQSSPSSTNSDGNNSNSDSKSEGGGSSSDSEGEEAENSEAGTPTGRKQGAQYGNQNARKYDANSEEVGDADNAQAGEGQSNIGNDSDPGLNDTSARSRTNEQTESSNGSVSNRDIDSRENDKGASSSPAAPDFAGDASEDGQEQKKAGETPKNGNSSTPSSTSDDESASTHNSTANSSADFGADKNKDEDKEGGEAELANPGETASDNATQNGRGGAVGAEAEEEAQSETEAGTGSGSSGQNEEAANLSSNNKETRAATNQPSPNRNRPDSAGQEDENEEGQQEREVASSSQEYDGKGKGKGKGDGDGEQETGTASGSGSGGSVSSAPQPPSTDLSFSDAELEKAYRDLEQQATSAVAAEIRRQSKVENVGRPLHHRLDDKTYNDGAIYVDVTGRATSTTIHSPKNSELHFQHLSGDQKKQGRSMAQYLKNVRDQTEERLAMQTRGKLDRGRFVAAIKGARDVYEKSVEASKTSFVASVSLDQSSSMSEDTGNGNLYNATMVLAHAFKELGMPYEVRGFSGENYQYKALEDDEFNPFRAERLTSAGGGTQMKDTVGLSSTSLRARPEKNKLAVYMSDGALGDHQDSVALLSEARKNGVATFGLFFGPYPPEDKLNELYGQGSWVAINKLEEMPRAVGLKIANILKRIR